MNFSTSHIILFYTAPFFYSATGNELSDLVQHNMIWNSAATNINFGWPFCYDNIVFFQVRTFRGHKNEKNFVGLSVNNEYIACGSETNEVFVYHKVIASFCPGHVPMQHALLWCVTHYNQSDGFLTPHWLQAISKPAASHRFVSSDPDDADDDPGSYFISAVCWKSDSPTMLTANSQGTIKVLVLAPWRYGGRSRGSQYCPVVSFRVIIFPQNWERGHNWSPVREWSFADGQLT
jgi:hypothetical protein